ncbi:hypothetical protein OIU76_003162 [Salix suchowensis]|nr:hypothetical protein OIU76_003162 [Salix suchowensis]
MFQSGVFCEDGNVGSAPSALTATQSEKKFKRKTVAEEEFLNQQTKTVAEGAYGFSKSDSSSARKGDVFGVNWRKKKRKRRRRIRDKLEDRLQMAKRQGRI